VEAHLSTVQRLKEEEDAATALMARRCTAPLPLDTVPPAMNFPRPPLSFIGPDPSTKKEDELFGFEFGSEVEVRDLLCPPGLTPEQAKFLTNAVVDVVALPGGFTSGYKEKDGTNMALMSAALGELVHQGRSVTENAIKSDLQWRSEKRIALRTIKNPLLLSKRLWILLKL
jgi:hypothetical protein